MIYYLRIINSTLLGSRASFASPVPLFCPVTLLFNISALLNSIPISTHVTFVQSSVRASMSSCAELKSSSWGRVSSRVSFIGAGSKPGISSLSWLPEFNGVDSRGLVNDWLRFDDLGGTRGVVGVFCSEERGFEADFGVLTATWEGVLIAPTELSASLIIFGMSVTN